MSNVIPANLVKPKPAWKVWFDRIRHLSWTWRIMWFYLSAMLFLPLGAMFVKAGSGGWAKFWEVASSPLALSTYDITFTTSLIATLINGLFGTAIAWVLVRYDFPGKRIIDASIDLPFALPTSVAGLILATVYSDNGWIGSLFVPFGIKIAFTRLGLGMAMFVDREEAARTLGASDWQIFWRVTLPNIRWGLMYGVLLTNARAMGEFGAVSVVSGNVANTTQSLPLFVEEAYKQYNTEAAFSAAVLLALLAAVTLILKEILESKTRIEDK